MSRRLGGQDMKKFALVLVFAMAACGRDNTGTGGSGGAGGTGGTAGTGGTGGGMATTIAALRTNPPGEGVTVTLNNVVVVQEVDSTKHGDVYVQDMGGGAHTAIHLFCNYGGMNPNCLMETRQQIQMIQRGQVINVTGNVKHFKSSSAPASFPGELELDAPVITSTGMTATPTATNVTASQVAESATATNTYEGTYVKVTDGPFMISNVMPTAFEGTCPIMTDGGSSPMTWFGVEATHTSQTLAIGLTFHTETTNPGSLSWCSGTCFTCPTAMQLSGHSFSTVAGLADVDFNSSTATLLFKVMPTVDADLAP
jgi:hypothetical protein